MTSYAGIVCRQNLSNYSPADFSLVLPTTCKDPDFLLLYFQFLVFLPLSVSLFVSNTARGGVGAGSQAVAYQKAFLSAMQLRAHRPGSTRRRPVRGTRRLPIISPMMLVFLERCRLGWNCVCYFPLYFYNECCSSLTFRVCS